MYIHEGNKFYPTRHPQVKQCSILLQGPTMGKHTRNVSKNKGNAIPGKRATMRKYIANVHKNDGKSILCKGPKMCEYKTNVNKNIGNSILCKGPTMSDTIQMCQKTIEMTIPVTHTSKSYQYDLPV